MHKNILGIRTFNTTQDLETFLGDGLQPYKYCSGPTAIVFGRGHLAEYGDKVQDCERRVKTGDCEMMSDKVFLVRIDERAWNTTALTDHLGGGHILGALSLLAGTIKPIEDIEDSLGVLLLLLLADVGAHEQTSPCLRHPLYAPHTSPPSPFHTFPAPKHTHSHHIIVRMKRGDDGAAADGKGGGNGNSRKTSHLTTMSAKLLTCKYFTRLGYIELPEVIKNKRVCINVKNYDQKCILLAIKSALFPVENYTQRVSKYKNAGLNIDKGIHKYEYPTKIDDIPKIENQIDTSINVYSIENESRVYPLKLTKHKKDTEGQADVTQLLCNRPAPLPRKGETIMCKANCMSPVSHTHTSHTVQCVRHTAGGFSVWKTVTARWRALSPLLHPTNSFSTPFLNLPTPLTDTNSSLKTFHSLTDLTSMDYLPRSVLLHTL
ncbi:hypothetical protein PR048_004726 [Dryococelus australis]|uniref:Uncharacterized protein n=1 Tax=Dryococelus australis TaxID=614101 RepID=A0ABQ9I708_9NEOP|nr:hypothetical protein PR048_004726 [Dryococelus australis]